MCQPFIASVLDIVEHDETSIVKGCAILSDALAPQVALEAPSNLLARVRRVFSSILSAYWSRSIDRLRCEDRLNRIFAVAAARQYDELDRMLAGPEGAFGDG